MAKANNQWQRQAAEAAERLDRARAAGEQLELLPAEPAEVEIEGPRAPGQRGKGKAGSQRIPRPRGDDPCAGCWRVRVSPEDGGCRWCLFQASCAAHHPHRRLTA